MEVVTDELRIYCDRGDLEPEEPERQRELWARVVAVMEELRELEDGYALRLPAARLLDAAAIMDIERRCCGFLELRLDARASEPYVWLTLTGPPGTKRVLATELDLMLGKRSR